MSAPGVGSGSLEGRIDRIESPIAIAALVAGYCEGLDRPDCARFADLWHPDAVLSNPAVRPDLHGRDDICAAQDAIEAARTRTFHLTSSRDVNFLGPDSAIGRSDCLAASESSADLASTYLVASYDDEFERRDGEWRFVRRAIRRWFATDGIDLRSLSERTYWAGDGHGQATAAPTARTGDPHG